MSAITAPRPRKSASHGEAGYARRPHDAYFTPAWVTEALLAAIDMRQTGLLRSETIVWEPACGDGAMAKVLATAGYLVLASDIADWGFGEPGIDFFDADAPKLLHRVDAIVTNPPFGCAVPFAQRAVALTKPAAGKVALLQRHEWDAPVSHHPLFRHPFAAKLVLPRRPRWSDDDRASPRFPYAWYLWDWAHQGPPILRFLPAGELPAKEPL